MSSKYQYSKLSDIDKEGDEYYNFYGCIIDATSPYKIQNGQKIISMLKVIDPTLYMKEDDPDSKNCAVVMLYGKRNEELPVVTKVGDIIRVHRA